MEYHLKGKIINGKPKLAIFDERYNRISDWFDLIYRAGLLEGKSEYYIVEENKKYAIFHKSGKRIGEWFDLISDKGLVSGENDFFIALKNGQWAVYYKSGKKIVDVDYPHTIEVLREEKFDKNFNLLIIQVQPQEKLIALLCNNKTCKKLKEFENKPSELNDEFIDKLFSEITLKEKSSKRAIKVEADTDLPTSNKKSIKRKIKL